MTSTTVPIGRYIRLASGDARPTEVTSQPDNSHTIPVFGGNGVMGYSRSHNFDGSLVAIGRVGAYCGNVQYHEGKAWVTDNALYVSEWLDGALPRYFRFLLESLRLDRLRSASGQPLVSQKPILAARGWVPRKDVQQRVADTLSLVEKQLSVVGTLENAKRTFKRGLMQQLLTGRKRFPQFRNDNWRSVVLGDLISYAPRKVPKPPGSFLSAGIRSHGKGVFLKKDFLAAGIALDELFELKHRDLVVNITFGWEGAVAIVPPEADGALVSHRFPTYEIDDSKVLVEFLRHVIRSRRFVFDVGVASPGGAGRNRVLNRQEFLEIAVKLPGIEEQGRIAQTLNDCDRELDLLAAQREQVENYRRALLSRLLSGSLPVP